MSNSILKISDGTTSVSLVSDGAGYHLFDWKPAIPDIKGGGVFQSSPFVDGRRLAFRRFDNAIETFDLKLSGFDQDNAIQYLQDLRRLLEKAVSYWTNGWQGGPVWIEAKGPNETNKRYAVIMDYRALADNNPYAQPFFSCPPVVDEFSLVIERSHWQSTQPGVGSCIERSNQQEWDIGENNLVLNGDFETAGGGGADVFLNWTEDTGGGGVIARDATFYFSQTHSCKLTTSNGGDIPGVTQTIAVTGFTAYRLRFWYLSMIGEPAPNYAYYTVYDVTYSDFIIAYAPLYDPLTAEWTLVDVPFTTPAGCISIRIDLYGFLGEFPIEYDFYYDYVSLVKVFEPTIDPGQEATCSEDAVFVANKWCKNNLTHIYEYDLSTLGFSNNTLHAAALPYYLFPFDAEVGDITYFGIDTAFADYGPFQSLVFDIGTAQVNITSIIWEYYRAAGWNTLPVRDNTALPGTVSFTQTGIHSVHWDQPTDWIPNVINGVNAYWVRARIVSVGGAVTRPTQQNRQPYTIVTPHIDIASTEVLGDIPALANVGLRQIGFHFTTGYPHDFIYGAYVSLRSISRGADFHQFINIANRQNISGVSVIVYGTHTSFVTDMYSPTGQGIKYDPDTSEASGPRAWITIGSTAVSNFMGEFHVFLRARQNAGSAGDFKLKLTIWTGSTIVYVSDEVYDTVGGGGIYVYDFGVIDFGKLYRRQLAGIYTTEIAILVYVANTNNATPGDLTMYDLVLVPTDEFCAFVSSSTNPQVRSNFAVDDILNADSLTVPAEEMLAYLSKHTDDTFVTDWKKVNAGPIILQANREQRLFVFVLTTTNTLTQSNPGACYSIHNLNAAQRYLSMRGDR